MSVFSAVQMDWQLKILYFLVDLAGPLGLGYMLARQRKIRVTTAMLDRVMLANLFTLQVLMAGLSFWRLELSRSLLLLPVLGLAMQAIPGVIGHFRARSKYDRQIDRGSFFLAGTISNRGIVGTLTVFMLFGETGYAQAQLVILLGALTLYMVFFPIAQHYHDSHHGLNAGRAWYRGILNKRQLPILGILAGVALNIAGPPRPEVFDGMFPWFIHISAWTFLTPVGFAMDFRQMKSHWGDVAELLVLRFIISPLAVTGLALAMGLGGQTLASVAVLACAPTAINAVVTTKLFGLNLHLTMAAFVSTTVVYLLIVLPIIFIVLRMLGYV